MRKRKIIGLIAVVVAILGGGVAVTQAQKARVYGLSPQPDKGWQGRAGDQGKGEAIPLPEPGQPAEPARTAVGDDPMGAVDSFLDRSRKEADESIQALTREEEALRARLQKVEAALARWQTVAGALGHETPNLISSPEPAPPPATRPVPEPTQLEPVSQPPLAPPHSAPAPEGRVPPLPPPADAPPSLPTQPPPR